MKSSELRTGNLYVDIDNKLTELSAYYLYQMKIKENTENLGINEYKPILLTKQWLLKFGFEKYHSNLFVKGNISIHFDMLHEYFYLSFGYKKIQIKYVHQLQNLYFALTYEELQLKLES